MKSSPKLLGIIVFIVAGITTAGTAHAAFGCYDPGPYPDVYRLSMVNGEIHALLEPDFTKLRGPGPHINPVAVKQPGKGWSLTLEQCNGAYCQDAYKIEQPCPVSIDLPVLTLKEFKKYHPGDDTSGTTVQAFGQSPSSCVVNRGIVWFGVGYFCDEESCQGVGGVGRYDNQTGAVEIRYPEALINSVVSPIIDDGNFLWVGTYASGDCLGSDPTEGLARYDWAKKSLVTFAAGTDSHHNPNGPCGIQFHDFLLTKEGLWVSSDFGLAFLSNPDAAPEDMHWVNFVPVGSGDTGKIVEMSCANIFAHLLKTLPHNDMNGADEDLGHYQQLVRTLRQFNPVLLQRLEAEGEQHP